MVIVVYEYDMDDGWKSEYHGVCRDLEQAESYVRKTTGTRAKLRQISVDDWMRIGLVKPGITYSIKTKPGRWLLHVHES